MQFEATLSASLSVHACVCVCKLRVRQAWLADRWTDRDTRWELRQGKKEITVPHSVGKSATEMCVPV